MPNTIIQKGLGITAGEDKKVSAESKEKKPKKKVVIQEQISKTQLSLRVEIKSRSLQEVVDVFNIESIVNPDALSFEQRMLIGLNKTIYIGTLPDANDTKRKDMQQAMRQRNLLLGKVEDVVEKEVDRIRSLSKKQLDIEVSEIKDFIKTREELGRNCALFRLINLTGQYKDYNLEKINDFLKGYFRGNNLVIWDSYDKGDGRDVMNVLLEWFRREFGQEYLKFKTVPKVDDFIAKVADTKKMLSILIAANSIGKTYLMVHIVAFMIWPNLDNPHFRKNKEDGSYEPYPLFSEKWPFKSKDILVYSTATNIFDEGQIMDRMRRFFPVGSFTEEKANENDENRSLWRIKDSDFTIRFLTHSQRKELIEGGRRGVVIIDEWSKKQDMVRFLTRLFQEGGGKCLIFAAQQDEEDASKNDLEMMEFVEDEYINKTHNEILNEDGSTKLVPVSANYSYINAYDVKRTEDNPNGYLTQSDIEQILSILPMSAQKARILNIREKSDSLIFHNFNRSVHVVDDFELEYEDHLVVCQWDVHPSKPKEYFVWFVIDRNLNLYVYKDFEYTFRTYKDLASELALIEQKWHIVHREMDPSGRYKTTVKTKESVISQPGPATYLNELGYEFMEGSKKRQECEMAILNLLDYPKNKKGEKVGEPKLYFVKSAIDSILDIERYRIDPKTGKGSKKGDDRVECIGRFAYWFCEQAKDFKTKEALFASLYTENLNPNADNEQEEELVSSYDVDNSIV